MRSWPLSSYFVFSQSASGLANISVLLCCLTLGLGARQSHAQVTAPITADTTLQAEDSIVDTASNGGSTTYTITGGAHRDTTLFHSFEAFSIPTGDRAVFANSAALSNIISRVTGDNLSRLDGRIQASGNANVFLINPNGIVIGPAAQLEIGGSFFASAGEGLRFDDGFVYSARSPTLPPLLSMSAPIGLALGDMPGRVEAITPTLSVAEGQTLALSGGDVSLRGAQLTAAGGRIEIDSLGNISLLEQSILDTTGPGGGAIDLQGQRVRLAGQSALISDTLGGVNGNGIRVNAVDFSSEAGSFVGAATSGTGASSPIEITAADITIEGLSFVDFSASQSLIFTGGRQISDRQTGGLFSFTTGSGNSGDITLRGQRIQLSEGASVSSETLGTGRSGDIEITATERIGLNAAGVYAQSLTRVPLLVDRLTQTPTGQLSRGIPAGSAGNITLTTSELLLEDGGLVSSSTLSDGNAGDLLIRATDSVVLQQLAPVVLPLLPSLLANVSIGGNGSAGDLTIETGRLVMQQSLGIFSGTGLFTVPFGGPAGDITIVATDSIDLFSGSSRPSQRSVIDLSSFSAAAAGSLNLTTPLLSIREGANISGATLNAGAGGAIQIEASEIVILGRDAGELGLVSGIFSISGDFGPTVTTIPFTGGPATGKGGTIAIAAQNLSVQGEATISVESAELGAAGNLNITAERIQLADGGNLNASTATGASGNIVLTADQLSLNNAQITAESTRGDGGNLALTLQEVLLLRNGSLISTEAGIAGTGGDGGDITLSTGFVVAVPSENSDIRANAFEGDGGNVTVTARNLLGIAFRPGLLDSPSSDITASSRFGRNGEVVVTELNPDALEPERELPVDTAPPTVARGCRGLGAQTGSFVSSGRGGLPEHPTSPLSADGLWQDLAPLDLESSDLTDSETNALENQGAVVSEPIQPLVTTEPIVEARAWQRDRNGTVTLLAQSTESVEHLTQPGTCLSSTP